MKENINKRSLLGILILLFLLFVFGAILGVFFLLTHPEHLPDTLPKLYAESNTDYVGVFSGFLFGTIVYFLFLFVFGLTFLGVLVVPAIVFLKGTVLGVAFTVLFSKADTWEYVRKWLCFGPSAFCLVLMLIFALHAFCVSRELCRQFKYSFDACLLIKKFGVHFIFTFFLSAISGGIYLLSVFCGNLL